jgi:hypothetical protein
VEVEADSPVFSSRENVPLLAAKWAAFGNCSIKWDGFLGLVLIPLIGNYDVIDTGEKLRDAVGAPTFTAMVGCHVNARLLQRRLKLGIDEQFIKRASRSRRAISTSPFSSWPMMRRN